MNITTYNQDGWPISTTDTSDAAQLEQLESILETLLLDQLEGDINE